MFNYKKVRYLQKSLEDCKAACIQEREKVAELKKLFKEAISLTEDRNLFSLRCFLDGWAPYLSLESALVYFIERARKQQEEKEFRQKVESIVQNHRDKKRQEKG